MNNEIKNMDLLINKKKRLYCGNCGKYGHVYKKCNEPVTSLGIITFKLEIDKIKEEFSKFDTSLFMDSYDIPGKNINILKSNNRSYNNLKYLNYFKDKIKFLLIRRKNTLGYIEFIRGKYEIDDVNYLIYLFEQMTYEEISNIAEKDLSVLWHELWQNSSSNKTYEFELVQSEQKFNKLKNSEDDFNLEFYTKNIKPKFDTPEWGFPKGRRNLHERNLDCAKREFFEETGFNTNEYKLLENIHPLNEVFVGTNGILYKHVYFLAYCNNEKNPILDPNNHIQIDEIGDIGWFTYEEALKIVRPYHTERKKILNELMLFIIENVK